MERFLENSFYTVKAVGGGREVKNWSFSALCYLKVESMLRSNFFTELKKSAHTKSYGQKRVEKKGKNWPNCY